MHQRKQSLTAETTGRTSRERSVFDLSDFSERKRRQAVEAFGHLSSGDSLEIVTRRQPGRLFFELQACYGPGFYWWPLERGPLIWRVMLAKPASGVQLTVTDVMGADHHRLHKLCRQFESAVWLCQIDYVHRCSAELSLGLRRYIDIEESVLFPLIEAQTGMGGGLTAAMRSEHREIERVIAQLLRLSRTADCATILQMFDQPAEPMAFFQSHCQKEEAALYPVMERWPFNHAEERELVSLIQVFEI